MKFLKQLSNLEILMFILINILLLASLYYGFTDATYFNEVFAKEDGTIENLTAIGLFMISILQLTRVFKFKNQKGTFWILGTLFFALLFFFGGGEEISWGQRIFNIQSGEFFEANNLQNETNLHNLEIGGVKLNKLIFSQLLVFGLVIYLLILPILYRKSIKIQNITDRFAIPVPQIQHTIAFIVSTIVIVIIPKMADRRFEVHELIFALVFLLIFLNPYNKNIYQ